MILRLFSIHWRRVLTTTLCLASAGALASPITVSESPGTNLELTLKAIQSAKESIRINVYEFTSKPIAEAIIERMKEGVKVDVLEEGQPVGGYSRESKEIRSLVVSAMNRASGNHFYMMEKRALGKRRFHYDHAKYIVIDGNQLLIGSENYSDTGNPEAGAKGNRGWEVFSQDPTVSKFFWDLFDKDTDQSFGDIVPYVENSEPFSVSMKLPTLESWPNLSSVPALPGAFDATSLEVVTAPDTSEVRLVQLIDSAQSLLEIEQMSFNSHWKREESPLFSAILRAAKRGVKIRVLLNDESVFARTGSQSSSHPNVDTVSALTSIAQTNHYDLEARIANIEGMGVTYIHNKGMLVDGNQVLVSSINWTENAVTNNREAAMLVTSPEVFNHYDGLFNADWNVSAR